MICKCCGNEKAPGTKSFYCKECDNKKQRDSYRKRKERALAGESPRNLYAAVDITEEESTLYVGTAEEMAEWAGISKKDVWNRVNPRNTGRYSGYRIVRLGKI